MVKIAFFGTPAFAIPSLSKLIASSHRVVAVVTQPDRPRGRSQQLAPSDVKTVAVTHHVPVLTPERLDDSDFLKALQRLKPDLGVVAAYGRLLPTEVLTLPAHGLVNLHASLLPAYRGASPIQHAILDGNELTGITLMRVVNKLDAGPILAQAQHPIGPTDTTVDLERALAHIGASLLLRHVEPLIAGRLTGKPQDDAAATYAPRLTKANGQIDWHMSAGSIHNQVRAMHPWPRAFTYLERDAAERSGAHEDTQGDRYTIHRTAVHVPGSQESVHAFSEPGRIHEARGDLLTVVAGGCTALNILELQANGRPVMQTRAFLAGHGFKPGMFFTSRTSP